MKGLIINVLTSAILLANTMPGETIKGGLLSDFVFVESLELNNTIEVEEPLLNELERLNLQKKIGHNKNLFVLITSFNCKFCEKQKEVIDTNKSIQDRLSLEFDNFFELNNQELDLPEELYTFATPSILILNSDDEVILKRVGYQDNAEFVELLNESNSTY